MDDAVSKPHTSGRRMASARPAATTRRPRSTRKAGGSDAEDISAARWAGVALVVAALLGAIVLAIVSPSDGGSTAAPGVVVARPSVVPSAGPTDDRVPTEQPLIVDPADGKVTGEWDVDLKVSVPQDPLPRRLLTLEILRDGEVIKSQKRPKAAEVAIGGVRLERGPNELTAALRGPGGLGPESEPVTIQLDTTPPTLTVATPRDNRKTTATTVRVSGTSEPGTDIDIRNAATGWKNEVVVGPSGSFDVQVPLQRGDNRIVIRGADQAGIDRKIVRFVTRKSTKPVAQLKAPKNVKLGKLPRNLRIQVLVEDSTGEPMEGADVSFTLSVPGQVSEVHEARTGANGKAVWQARVPKPGTRSGTGQVGVEVTSATGEQGTDLIEISFS